jgi:hypothetical protein
MAVAAQGTTSCPTAYDAPAWATIHPTHPKSMSSAHGMDGKPL